MDLGLFTELVNQRLGTHHLRGTPRISAKEMRRLRTERNKTMRKAKAQGAVLAIVENKEGESS